MRETTHRQGMPDAQDVEIYMETQHREAHTSEGERKSFRGTRHERRDKLYLRYRETLAEDEPPVPTMITIEGCEMKLHRKGTYGGDMVFRAGEHTRVAYRTPMGVLPMEIHTKKLDLFLAPDSVEIELSYDLYTDGQDAIATDMRIVAVTTADSC